MQVIAIVTHGMPAASRHVMVTIVISSVLFSMSTDAQPLDSPTPWSFGASYKSVSCAMNQ